MSCKTEGFPIKDSPSTSLVIWLELLRGNIAAKAYSVSATSSSSFVIEPETSPLWDQFWPISCFYKMQNSKLKVKNKFLENKAKGQVFKTTNVLLQYSLLTSLHYPFLEILFHWSYGSPFLYQVRWIRDRASSWL